MTTATKKGSRKTDGGATTGYEAELWALADGLRGSMDAAEYKHVVLGLIFLKYISDAFEERHAAVLAEWGPEAAEDRDEYIAENIFWNTHLLARVWAKSPQAVPPQPSFCRCPYRCSVPPGRSPTCSGGACHPYHVQP